MNDILPKKTSNYSWYTENSLVYLLVDGLPFANFDFYIIAFIKLPLMKWSWVWEEKDNVLDKRIYPAQLKRKLTHYRTDIVDEPDRRMKEIRCDDPKVMYALYALKGMWFAYLIDKNTINVVILKKISYHY